MSKRKIIRKLLRDPAKAKCRKCNAKMVLHQDPNNTGHLTEYFQCVDCFKTVYINREKRRKKGKKEKRIKTQPTSENTGMAVVPVAEPKIKKPIVDEDNLVFELIMQKIKDKFYDMGNNISYNPVKKVIVHLDKERTADNDEHEEYMKTIYNNINRYV